jgi:endonuclease YncB( thermonuclease family)
VTEPVAVARESGGLAGRTVTAISAGSTHVCAIADGRAFCWGDNFSGQLGTGTTTSSPRPVAVVIEAGRLRGRTVTDISAGDRTTCAVADARAFCWGDSSRSEPSIESADGVLVSLKPVPVDTSGVLAGQRVTRVVTGGGDTMAAVLFGAPPAPIRVKGVDVVVRKGTAKVTWKPVAGATAYGVRLSKPGGKGYQKWVSTAKPMLRVGIRKGKTYRVQVQAITPKARGVVTTFRFRAR